MGVRTLTIGGLAKSAGVPISTVRYYERAGLLKPRSRSPSNYRLYSEEDVHRLRFIRAAKTTGFTIDDVTELLRPSSCRNVQTRINRRLDEIADRMTELRHVQKVLKASLQECREHEKTGRCAVIDTLSATTRAKRP